MKSNNNIFNKKPTNYPHNETDEMQLFSFDVSKDGAKNFMFETYTNIYRIIKSNKYPSYYEDNTFSKGIKLHIDYDE